MQQATAPHGVRSGLRCPALNVQASRRPARPCYAARAAPRFNRDLLLDNVDTAGGTDGASWDWRPNSADPQAGPPAYDYGQNGQSDSSGWSYDEFQQQREPEQQRAASTAEGGSVAPGSQAGFPGPQDTLYPARMQQQQEQQQYEQFQTREDGGGERQDQEWSQAAASRAWGPGSSSGDEAQPSDWGEAEPLREWGQPRGWQPAVPVPGSAARDRADADPDGPRWDTAGAAAAGRAGPSSSDAAGGWDEAQFVSDGMRGGSGDAPAGGSEGAQGETAFAVQPSDIVLLTRPEAGSILPLAPTSSQASYYQPKSLQEQVVQYLGSLGTSIILSKAALVAAPALLYPIWSPWLKACGRNLEMYSQSFQCVGLWRAKVLDVQMIGFPYNPLFRTAPPSVSLLIGDPWPGGARTQLELPYTQRAENIQVGDDVELLVLSREQEFLRFKVVRELYMPQTGLWLADYPFLNRDLFLQISLQIEQGRRQEQGQGGFVSPPYGGYSYDAGGPTGGSKDYYQ